MGLLKWLATSQAADDINSDDELLRDTILSPFLPATRIEEVLEKANMDYESESQKECQDILDSVDDFVDFKDIKERADFSKNSRCPNLSSGDFIPQVDGAGDDMFTPPARSTEDFYATECKRNFDEACEQQVFLEDTRSEKKVVEDAHSSFNHKHKRKKLLWGSLPFSTNEKLKDESFCTDTKGPITTSPLSGYMGEHELSSIKDVKTDICDGNETAPLVACSVRDLMRRKRHHRVESLECSSQGLEKSLSEMKQKDKNIFPRNLDFQVFPIDEPNKRPCVSLSFPTFAASLQEVYDVKATGDDSPGKLPILSRSGSSLVGSTADDGNFTSPKSDNSYGSGVATQSGNFLSTGPSYVQTRSSLSMPGSPDSAAAIGHSKNSQEPRVLLLKSDFEDNTFAAERLEPTNAAASTCHQTAVGRDELNVNSGNEGRSSRELEHEMSPKKSVAMNMTTNINALNSGQGQGGDVPLVITMDQQDMDLICLTFYRKSPATDWNTGPSRKALSDSYISHLPCQDKESHDGASGLAFNLQS